MYGDGVYTFTAQYENGKDVEELRYVETGKSDPLLFPQNGGFTGHDLSRPLSNLVTFSWDTNPDAEYVGVFMSGGGEEKFDKFSSKTTSFGPFEYTPGQWRFELAFGIEREGIADGVVFTISKQTAYTSDGVVEE